MEILSNFGFDPVLLAAQVVNFLIIFYLLKRFLYKPILQMLKNRQEEVEKGLRDAEEGKRVLDEALEKEKEILTKARIESEKIVNEANTRAHASTEKTLEKAKQDAERTLVEAKETLERERKIAESELEEKMTKIAIEILEKSLSKVVGKKEQAQLTERAVKELKY